MDSTRVAVLTVNRINRYRVSDGELVGSTPVPADTAAELEATVGHAVFRTRHSVRLIDLSTGTMRTLATTTSWQPTAVAIDGRTVSWAESRRVAPGEPSRRTFQTRIRTLVVS
jgi:hypothetical protein